MNKELILGLKTNWYWVKYVTVGKMNRDKVGSPLLPFILH